MDFERVLFRVHAAAVDPLVDDRPRGRVRPREACRACGECFLLAGATLLLVSAALHASLGTDRCVRPALRDALRDDYPNATGWRLPRDAVVKIRLTASVPGDDALFALDDVATRRRLPDDDGPGFIDAGRRLAASSTPTAAPTASSNPWAVPAGDYTLTRDVALFWLDEERFYPRHRVRAYNVTVSARCLDASSSLARFFHRNILGYDTPLANQCMEALAKTASLRNDATGETVRWRRSDVRKRRKAAGAGAKAAFRFIVLRSVVLFRALLAFFLLSTVTALVLRVLVSSGVVCAFGLWHVLGLCPAVQAQLDFATLARAYPWLGAPLELLRAQGRPGAPMLAAHGAYVVVAYATYEAAQLAFSRWLYGAPLPAELGLACFGLTLAWECATMVHCRAAASIALVPRLQALYFLAFHGACYAMARPYAFLNLGVAALLMAHASLYGILEFEVPALARGDVDVDAPRARRTEMPWPALDAMLPPTWSLYMPLSPIDDDPFPDDADLPAPAGGGEDEEEETGDAGADEGGPELELVDLAPALPRGDDAAAEDEVEL